MVLNLIFIQLFVKVFLVKVVDVLVERANLQSIQQLFFDCTLNLRSLECPGFPIFQDLLGLPIDWHDHLLLLSFAQLQPSFADNHLMQLRQPLLAFVALKLAPELYLGVDHLESLRIILRQFYFLPQLIRKVCPLRRF